MTVDGQNDECLVILPKCAIVPTSYNLDPSVNGLFLDRHEAGVVSKLSAAFELCQRKLGATSTNHRSRLYLKRESSTFAILA